VPFAYPAVNSQQATGVDEPRTVDHYHIQVGSVSSQTEMYVKVSNITVSGGAGEVSLCLNYNELANSPTGGCCETTNSSIGDADFQIKVGACALQQGNYYASVQVPPSTTVNYTLSAFYNGKYNTKPS
jgi:hypothetical protein